MKIIVNENFNDFPLEEFPYDKNHSAIGEYHHYMPEGYTGNFYDPINNHQWRSMDGSWLVTEIDGIRYMEQNRGHFTKGYFHDLTCLLVLKDLSISEYIVETNITMLSTKFYSGIAFDYTHSQKYMGVKFDNDKIVLYYKNQDTTLILQSAAYKFEANTQYDLKLIKNNKKIEIVINGKKVIIYNDKQYTKNGSIALLSQNPARYQFLTVTQTNEAHLKDSTRIRSIENKVVNKRKKYSPIKLVKKIDLKGFGAGRQLRIFKHNDKAYFIFAQHEKKIFRDAYASISGLTCFDDEGKLVWQIGKPSNNIDNGLISCDLPFQVSDMNNDGIPELIYSKDFKVYICNALTGEVIKVMNTPTVKNDPLVATDYPFDNLNVDAIRVANFTGKDTQSDFILKDRYHNVWAFDYNFNLLFRYNHKNTGHFPYIYDIDGDGIDEMIVGYDYVKKGKIVWSLPFNSDHTDEIIWGPLKEDEEYRILLASGNEGFNVVSKEGEIIKSIPVGHAQRISLAKFDKNLEGYQVCVTSFWGSNGIVYTFNSDLELIAEKEMVGNGNIITPVNYDNSNEQLILSNTDPYYGGLLDIDLNVVVKFPDDNHPTLASEAIDIDGDGITEILTWDLDQLWIYKCEKPKNKSIKQFYQYPDNAFSNYRGEFLIELKG